ncbi:DUF3383 family protein [Acetobacter thailandicus]|uniref:DUF3383 family protein n=1 Tax=Acetobacter thailandicus TaxID=1502842 RepID=UPI001BAAB7AB|nr:DUF3383 family protein [Acetobacter thailandicus]MBS0961128.1 DUF3383 family protein [Acetobacter thailandicus]
MTLPVSSLVSVTPGVISPGGTVNLLNGMLLSANTALDTGVNVFTSASAVAQTCGASGAEAQIAGVYFSAYTNAQDLPSKLYIFKLPPTPAESDYGTYLDQAAAAAPDWAPFMFATEPSATAKNKILTWMAANPNRYWGIIPDSDETILTTGAASSFGATVKAQKTPGLTCLCNTDGSGILAAALCLGWAASLNPRRTGGRTTLMFRNNGAVTAADITPAQAVNLLANGYSFYGSYKTSDSTFNFINNGAVSGEFAWADSYINQIWMNAAFQSDLVTLLTSVGQIPYTTKGDSLISTAVQSTIDTAVSFGAVQPNVTLSASQVQTVNAQAGRTIDDVLSTRGWYLLPGASAASASVRASRGAVAGRFFYTDGESVQSISLASVEVQ